MGNPKVQFRTFKIQEIIDAAKDNGLDHIRGAWLDIDADSNKIIAGCVLGQTAINIGCYPFASVLDEDLFANLPENMILPELTGREYSTLLEALNQFEVPPDSKWDYAGSRAGEAIVHWNDAYTDNNRDKYLLSTYAEVAEMVEDILGPYRNETITLQVVDYSFALPKSWFNAVGKVEQPVLVS